MVIHSLAEAEAILSAYVPAVKEKQVHYSLETMGALMSLIGDPQDKMRIVHVAGTSGKTSTSYYIAALLVQSGCKVGLTVSPHIDKVTERVQINLSPLSDEVFCSELGIFLDLLHNATLTITYFELLIAFAYWEFDRQGVDYAVIETGVGGLLDGSNVATHPDKVCVITDIGLDHVHLLGNTLPEIAAQKAGIIHEQNHVFMMQQPKEVLSVFEAYALTKHAPLHILHTTRQIESMPDYQQRNWSLAQSVFDFLCERDGVKKLTEFQLNETQKTVVPSRMQVIQRDGKTIILDGAHNQQKMATFVHSFTKLYPQKKVAVLLAVKEDKAFIAVVNELLSIAHFFIFTTFSSSQDLPAHAIDPTLLGNYCEEKNLKNYVVIHDHTEAYERLMSRSEDVLVITGSFYLLAQLRKEKELR
jgi:dihydrofolate synthase / folylpolyglutamate synthase